MQHTENRNRINELVQLAPSPSEPPLHLLRRGHGEGDHAGQRQHTDRYVRPLDDVVEQCAPFQTKIEQCVSQEMQDEIEEREQTQQTPKSHEGVVAGESPRRRHCERDQEQIQGGLAHGMQHELDGVRTEALAGEAEGPGNQERERREAR